MSAAKSKLMAQGVVDTKHVRCLNLTTRNTGWDAADMSLLIWRGSSAFM